MEITIKAKTTNVLILIFTMATIFFIAKETYASTENHIYIKEGKLYLEVSSDLEGNCEIISEGPAKQIATFLEGVSCAVCNEKIAKESSYCTLNKCKHSYCENCSNTFGVTTGTITDCLFNNQHCTNKNFNQNEVTINKPSSVVAKKYYALDLLRSKFKNLNLQKMDLRGIEISDENLQNNNFEHSIMDANTRNRFLKLKLENFESSICKDTAQYIKFINGLQVTDDSASIASSDKKIIDDFIQVSVSKCLLSDKKILENDSSLARLLNSPLVASNSLLLESIVQEYFKTHSISQLNSLLGKIPSEDIHLLFKREGLEKSAHSYEDYLRLMIPVEIEGQKKPKERYVEKLKSFVDETKYLILDKSEIERFGNDWEKKYRNYSDEGNTVLALGGQHSCALKNDGSVVCWGRNNENQSTPPFGLSDVKSIALGGIHSCALKNDGSVVCWGYNGYSQSTPPRGLSDVKSIALGGIHSCALKNDGSVVCWGSDGHYQSTPPPGLSDVKSIALGGIHSCALKNDGSVVCWGNDGHNQSTSPSGLSDVKSIALGDHHSCALKNDGSVVCWGDNRHNQSTPPENLRVKID
ncbi:MAG: hypothetical protein HQK49_18505 [Oligoflexia bacterium]|nr:hypothetical protein [Oligoflexia bacterium]